jgi:hypothetical protein
VRAALQPHLASHQYWHLVLTMALNEAVEQFILSVNKKNKNRDRDKRDRTYHTVAVELIKACRILYAASRQTPDQGRKLQK